MSAMSELYWGELLRINSDKLEKWKSFHQTSISFLWYVIGTDGVVMDEKKVNAILNWPNPKTLKKLQRFLGFANFYRRFITNFSTVAAPLTTLTKRGRAQLLWKDSAKRAFVKLKTRFAWAPILCHPNPNLPLTVEIDASNMGIGAVLSQRQGDPAKLNLCTFFSRKLNPAERNYNVGNQDLLAMKATMEKWRHWLEEAKRKFTVITDHKNLEYIRSAKRPNPRQTRWALFFTQFDISVTYIPGTRNTKTDALSHLCEKNPVEEKDQPILNDSFWPESSGMLIPKFLRPWHNNQFHPIVLWEELLSLSQCERNWSRKSTPVPIQVIQASKVH